MATSEIPETTDLLAQRLRVLQIIIAALVFGLLVLIGVAWLVISMQAPNNPAQAAPAPQPAASQPIVTYIACLFAVGMMPLSVIVPQLTVASGRKALASQPPSKEGDVAGLINVYQTKTIITGALRQGIGNFAAIAFMIERSPIALGLTFVLLITVAILFPTRDRLESWIDDQLGRLSQEREFRT
jgi:hypothetical protein